MKVFDSEIFEVLVACLLSLIHLNYQNLLLTFPHVRCKTSNYKKMCYSKLTFSTDLLSIVLIYQENTDLNLPDVSLDMMLCDLS